MENKMDTLYKESTGLVFLGFMFGVFIVILLWLWSWSLSNKPEYDVQDDCFHCVTVQCVKSLKKTQKVCEMNE